MTETMIRIMFVLGIAGHAFNMYCDRILSIFPNGTIKFANIKEVRKDGVLAEMMEGVSADVPCGQPCWEHLRWYWNSSVILHLQFIHMSVPLYWALLCLWQLLLRLLSGQLFMLSVHWQSMCF